MLSRRACGALSFRRKRPASGAAKRVAAGRFTTSAGSMKTLLYPEWDRVEIADRPRPSPAADEVVLRVAACGLCGSELEAFKSHSPRRTPPLVLGHEFCGVVEELGPGVAGGPIRVGRKVVSNSLVPCSQCVRCRRGDTHLCGKRQIF